MRTIQQTFSLTEELEVYDATTRGARRRTRESLESLRSRVERAYKAYAAATPVTALSTVLSATETSSASALKGNYTRLRSGTQSDIGTRLLSRSKTCCLCGHSPAGQLDHHLPKGVFPEFAALTINLIPACARCNQKKLETYRRADGGPAFLHSIQDKLPSQEQFLRARIIIRETVSAEFYVARTASMPEDMFNTLLSHFEALALAEVFGDLASELMVEKLTPIYAYFESGIESVKRYLTLDANGMVRIHGVNHWKHVLLRALAEDTAFCGGGFQVLGLPDD